MSFANKCENIEYVRLENKSAKFKPIINSSFTNLQKLKEYVLKEKIEGNQNDKNCYLKDNQFSI